MTDKLQQEDSTQVFPLRWPVFPREDRNPRVVEISDGNADEVFSALSSDTARALLSHLHDSPKTASDLAETVGTSVQNVEYHLQKFKRSELVEVVDTWYSTRGTEMKVYAPTDRSLVLYTGDKPGERPLDEALVQMLGGVGVLGIGSAIVDWLARKHARPVLEDSQTARDTSGNVTDELAGEGVKQIDPAMFEIGGITISPGILFFVGGLFILFIIFLFFMNGDLFNSTLSRQD